MMLDDINSRIRTVNLVRYLQPFKEGGSLPGLMAADDCFEYVIKYKGAGQGVKALIADFIGGEMARILGINVPEMVYAMLPKEFGQSEPDEEIQHLLKSSVGMNLGVHYLSRSVTFDPVATYVAPELANKIVWLDALLMNVDRTVKNTNMLVWNKELWLIDHGASLYFHHNMLHWKDMVASPFKAISKHVLVYHTKNITATDAWCKSILTEQVIDDIVALLPEEWLPEEDGITSADKRTIYKDFLWNRINNSEVFVNEIKAYER